MKNNTKIISLKNIPEESVSHEKGVKKKVMISRGLIPHLLNFSQAYIKQGYAVKTHQHEDKWEIFLIEKGKGLIKLENKTYKIKSGDCTAIRPKISHEIVNSGKKDLIVTYFGLENSN